MSIAILANNYDFFEKYGKDEKCIEFINTCSIFFRIRFSSHGLFGDRYDRCVLHSSLILSNNSNLRDIINNKYNYNKYILKDHSEFFNKKHKEYKHKTNCSKREKMLVKNISNVEILKIHNKFKYLEKYFEHKTILTGHLLLLHCLSYYPNYKIYLLGFKFSNTYIDGKSKPCMIRYKHSQKDNDCIIDHIIANYDNVILKNDFS